MLFSALQYNFHHHRHQHHWFVGMSGSAAPIATRLKQTIFDFYTRKVPIPFAQFPHSKFLVNFLPKIYQSRNKMSDAEYSVRFSEDEQEDPIPRKSFPKKKPTKLGRSLPSLYKSKYAPQPVPGTWFLKRFCNL